MSYLNYQPTRVRTKLPKSKLFEKLVERPTLAIREINNRSFYEFLKFFWSEISSERFESNWHIKLMCDRLQELAEEVAYQRSRATHKEHIKDLILNVPPGSTKTTTVMIMFPAWCWTRWYWMRFIALSYSAPLSLESAEFSRDLVRCDKFQSIYPDLRIKRDKDKKSNFKILKQFDGKPGFRASIKQGGNRFSTSVGGSVLGFHAHIILVDDPIDPEQAVSPKQLENVNRYLDKTLSTRKVHKACSPIVMIMQRLHQDDPTGHKIKQKKGKVDHICLPGQIRDYADEVKPAHLKKFYSEDGLLDSNRLNWDVLADMLEDLGQYGFSGQVGQSPTPPTGGMFKVDRFVVVDRRPPEREIEQIIRYWDKAGTEVKKGASTKSGPAWTAGIKMAKLVDGRYIILNVKRGRWSSEERETIIKDVAKADGIDVWVIVEQEPGSGGKESAEGTIKNLSGYRVQADRPSGDKVYRADPYSVQVNYGNVLLLQADWNKDFIEEHRFFPFSTFKDQVDSSAGAFNNLNKKKKVRVWGSKKH